MHSARSRTLHTLVGRSGSGKTLLLRKLLRESDRALVFDLLGHYSPGLIVRTQAEVKAYLARGPQRFRLVYRPTVDIANRQAVFAAADWLCMVARAVSPCEVVMDELDAFCDGSNLPPQLDVLIRYGRNIEVSLHAAVRRPRVVIPRHYVTETNRFSIFRSVDPLDAGFLSEYTTIPREEISALEPLEYFDWRDGEFSKKRLQLPGAPPNMVSESVSAGSHGDLTE